MIFLPKIPCDVFSGQPKLCVAKEQCRSNFYSNFRGACISRDVMPLELRAAPPGTHAMSREEWKGVCGTTISKYFAFFNAVTKNRSPWQKFSFLLLLFPWRPDLLQVESEKKTALAIALLSRCPFYRRRYLLTLLSLFIVAYSHYCPFILIVLLI